MPDAENAKKPQNCLLERFLRIVWSFGQQKESHRVTPPVQSENMHLNREIIIPKHSFEGKL